MSERPEGRRQDLQEREQFADTFVFNRLIPCRRTRMTYQWNFTRVGRDVGADTRLIHAVKTDSTLDVLENMLGGGRCNLVVDCRRNQILRACIQDDVGWER